MNRPWALPLGILVGAILAMLAVVAVDARRPRDITVSVDAPGGTKISGICSVDGARSEIDTIAPAAEAGYLNEEAERARNRTRYRRRAGDAAGCCREVLR